MLLTKFFDIIFSKVVFALGLIIILSSSVNAQNSKTSDELDTLVIKAHTYAYIDQQRHYFHFDTALILPYWKTRRLQPGTGERESKLYTNLEYRMEKTKVGSELFGLLFSIPNYDNTNQKKKDILKKKENAFQKYSGRRVRNIIVKRLESFGTHFPDTNYYNNTGFNKLGNGVHALTKRWVIKKNLLLKEGDLIVPREVSESERLVRRLPYIRDAKIYFLSIPNNEEQYDLLIVTKDVWSIEIDGGYSSPTKFNVIIDEENLFGLGNELRNKILYDKSRTPKVGYEGRYKIANIKHSFVDANFDFATSATYKTVRADIGRGFVSSEIKTAGGLSVEHTERINFRLLDSGENIEFFTKYNFADAWFAKGFDISSTAAFDKKRMLLGIGGSAIDYIKRPGVSLDTNQTFYNKKIILLKAGFNKRNYQKSGLVLQYGATEDIPIGYRFDVTFGKEFNEYHNRYYWNVSFSKGGFLFRKGYLKYDFAIGSFVRDGGGEQGVLKTEVRFFSNLYRRSRWAFRHFLKVGYTHGLRRYDDEYIHLRNENGIRGLNDRFFRGDKRINIKAESVAFSPFHILGFKTALFAFADVGIISDRRSFLKSTLYHGYGIGARLHNDNVIFDNILIRFAFYPATPNGSNQNALDFGSRSRLRLDDFDFSRPEVLLFR